jgi:hypothetical protein
VTPQQDVTRGHHLQQQQQPVTQQPQVYAAKVAPDSSAAAPGANGPPLSIAAEHGSESAIVDAVCVLQSPPGLSLPEVGPGALSGSNTVVVAGGALADVLSQAGLARGADQDVSHHHSSCSGGNDVVAAADAAGAPPGLAPPGRVCDLMVGVTGVMSPGDMSDPPGLQPLAAAAPVGEVAAQHASDAAAASGEGSWGVVALRRPTSQGMLRGRAPAASVVMGQPCAYCAHLLLSACACGSCCHLTHGQDLVCTC